MATAYDPEVPRLDGISQRAVVDDEGSRPGFFTSFMTGLSGLFLIVFPCLIWGAEELTTGLFALLVGMGAVIMIAALWEARDIRS
jgi:hypothetical protein